MKIKRKFIPGDKWIYFKIYTGVKTADTILLELHDIIQRELDNNRIQKWFFIRFYDPDFHIRLRFNIIDKDYIWQVIDILNRSLIRLVENKLVWKIQLDTYNRELERYGFELIEESEEVFYYNSRHSLDILKFTNISSDKDLRWRLGLFMVDRYLTFGMFSVEQKFEIFEMLKNNFGSEMNTNKSVEKNISKKFNNNKKQLEDFFTLKVNDPELKELLKHIDESYSSKLITTFRSIKSQTDENYYIGIISSHIHMIFNRLFKMNNRKAEYVCYEILYLYYKSAIARQKFIKKSV